MERQLLTALLTARHTLSERSQTCHLEFTIPGLERFEFEPGQFVSVVVERMRPDGRIKQETRAYSLASAPRGNHIDLCLNRVPRADAGAGFFSNLLCDLRPGEAIQFHCPPGDFTLREPLGGVILVAAETGIAPMRSMLQAAAANGQLGGGSEVFLLQLAQEQAELFYATEFEGLGGRNANFQYCPVTGGGLPDGSSGGLDIAAFLARIHGILAEHPAVRTAYICGLNEMVAPVRAALKELGWDRRQIIFERYD